MLGALALGWALAVGSVQLEAVRRSLWPRPARPSATPSGARVLVIRPCAGNDPWLEDALTSLAGARHGFTLRCRLAVADASDPAFAIAQRAASRLTGAGLDAAVVLTAARAPNRKAAQLAAVTAAEEGTFDAVIVADGDVDLTGVDLDALIAPLLARLDHGAVWAPPVEVAPPRTLGDRASAALLSASLHAFPILARLDRGGLVGKLFAVRADALAEIGGFGALARHLGEDMELARRLRARGRAVEAAPFVARSLSAGRTWDQAEERFGRWLTVIRAQRPALLPSYPLLFLATAPILALGALAAPSPLALAAALLALLPRLAVALVASAAAGRRLSLIDAALGDLLLAGAFLRALRSREVVWRDVPLTIQRGGVLAEKGS